MQATVSTGVPGEERTDRALCVTVQTAQAECDFFVSEQDCSLTLTDGSDVLTIEVPRVVAEAIFGKLGDALHRRTPSG